MWSLSKMIDTFIDKISEQVPPELEEAEFGTMYRRNAVYEIDAAVDGKTEKKKGRKRPQKPNVPKND